MTSEAHPSLGLVYEELKELVARQTAHAESLDSKASIVIGFTALVIGVGVGGPVERPPVLGVAIVSVTASFLLAVAAFWVRPFAASPQPRRLYANYPNLDHDRTLVMLANAAIGVFERNEALLRVKSRSLQASLATLTLSILTLVLAFFL